MDVNRLLKSFEMLQQMTKAMTKGGGMRGLGGMMGGFGGKVAKGAMHVGFGRKTVEIKLKKAEKVCKCSRI